MTSWFKFSLRGSGAFELVEFVSHHVEIIGEGELQVLVLAHLNKFLEEWIDWHFFGPEVGAEENHRAGESEGLVVVLHGVLEDFLHGASTARGVDDAAEGYREDKVFADAVFEELGDVGGEGC